MNQVRSHINHIQNIIHAIIPSVQQEVLVFDGFEVDCIIDSINSASNQLEIVQVSELLFTVVLVNLDQLTDSGQSQAAVIFWYDSEVVLDQHTMKLLAMGLWISYYLLQHFRMSLWRVRIYQDCKHWCHRWRFPATKGYLSSEGTLEFFQEFHQLATSSIPLHSFHSKFVMPKIRCNLTKHVECSMRIQSPAHQESSFW